MREREKDTPELLRHLVRMHQAGLPWLQSLQMWRDACRRPQQVRDAEQLMAAVRSGLSLTEALGQGGWLVRPLQALSQAGEESGTWSAQMAQWLARHEAQTRMWRQVRSALAYPLLVLLLAAAVLVGVLHWVLPVFESLYRSLHAELPWATRALLSLSAVWVEAGWLIWPSPLVVAAGGLLGWRDPVWRPRLERWLWRSPWLGRWWQMHLEALWCGLLSQLLQAGLDWRAALALVGPATASPWMAWASAQMGRDLALGHALATAMAAGNRRGRVRCGRELFSPTLVQWVYVGEAAGTLPSMLGQWSKLQSEALAQQWQLASRLLEPVLMGVLGLGMGWLVLALYLPVIQMGQWV